MTSLTYKIGGHRCRVVIGASLQKLAASLIREAVGGNRLFVVIDANVYALHWPSLEKSLQKYSPILMVIPSGESTKCADQADRLRSWMLDNNISRQDFVLAVGGGVTSDLVGFVASTILRGVRWGIVSTTLLGMIDASLGGKTGINHRTGKNLIGTFWQPTFVVCDTHYLATLPKREYRAAHGELLKYAVLVGRSASKQILKFAREDEVNSTSLESVIASCVRYKMSIVRADERELSGLRIRLNLGHTFAHAIEKSLGYGALLHGEAVTLGLFAAIELSGTLQICHAKSLHEWKSAVRQAITSIPERRLNTNRLLEAMKVDKKRQGKSLRFVLPVRPGKPILVTGVDAALVRRAVDSMLHAWQE